MSDIRDKLLEAIDGSFADLTDNALVDVLLDQLRRTKTQLNDARNAILKEGIRANDLQKETIDREHRMRGPMRGNFYFSDNVSGPGVVTGMFIVSIDGAYNISMCRREGSIDYMIMQITPEEFQARAAKR